MKFAENKLKVGIKGISIFIGLIVGCAVFSQAYAWDRMDSFEPFEPFEPMVIAVAKRPKDISPAYTATMTDIMQLKNVTEPRDAFGSSVFSRIKDRGADAVDALIAVAKDTSKNTDARKWALSFLGWVASKEQAVGVRDFLLRVSDGGDWRYQSWHRTEARRGLSELYDRFPEVNPENDKSETEDKASAYTATMVDIMQLKNVTEPRDAFGSSVFNRIKERGADAVDALIAVAEDTSKNTDARKWALSFLGYVASKEQAVGVRDFLLRVSDGGDWRYESWHRTEARRGLNELYNRFPEVKKPITKKDMDSENAEKANLMNNLSGWEGQSIVDRLPVDFLPTKKIY